LKERAPSFFIFSLWEAIIVSPTPPSDLFSSEGSILCHCLGGPPLLELPNGAFPPPPHFFAMMRLGRSAVCHFHLVSLLFPPLISAGCPYPFSVRFSWRSFLLFAEACGLSLHTRGSPSLFLRPFFLSRRPPTFPSLFSPHLSWFI